LARGACIAILIRLEMSVNCERMGSSAWADTLGGEDTVGRHTRRHDLIDCAMIVVVLYNMRGKVFFRDE